METEPMRNQKADFLLLVRGEDWDQGLSPEELQRAMTAIMAWFESLRESGCVKGGHPLGREGIRVSGKAGAVVCDGPFAESKEAVGGYLMVQAIDLEAAAAIAKTCPSLNYGVTIEVRPVLEECPVFQRAKERLLIAAA